MVDLSDLKDALRIDFNDDDDILDRKLKTAIQVVERYTGHSLRDRSITYISDGKRREFFEYPITVNGGDVVEDGFSTFVYAKKGDSVTITFGVSEHENLWEAVIRIASYLYENIDINEVSLPADVQLLINQFRRDSFIG